MSRKGLAHNIFEIDSTFSSGKYEFKAYTNWMRNFDEKLYFNKSITILDPNSGEDLDQSNQQALIDVQAFPESGQLLENLENVVGILVKNQFGKGVDIDSGAIVNQKNDTLATFKLDKFGISRASIRPLDGESYFVKVNYGTTTYETPITSIKKQGLMLSLLGVRDQVFLKISTNLKTLPNIKDKTYKLIMHNANSIKTWTFKFSKGPRLEMIIEKEALLSGMNIFTVLDDNNNPLLERLYFNHHDIPTMSSFAQKPVVVEDSLQIRLKVPNAKPSMLNNLSISVFTRRNGFL